MLAANITLERWLVSSMRCRIIAPLLRFIQFVRLEHDTNVSDLKSMMLHQWRVEKPNLLISVTGGAKNFRLNPRLKEVFRHGLIKAADSTGAWIVTGGMNAGVMKHVGEAIRDSAIARGANKNPIVAIGIATWGCVNNREALVNPKVRLHLVMASFRI